MKRLLYVYPGRSDSSIRSGVDLKVMGQLLAFQTQYQVSLIRSISRPKNCSIFIKIWYYFLSQFRFIVRSLRSDVVYYRYMCDMTLYNFAILIISLFSIVWIEYNSIKSHEIEHVKLCSLLKFLLKMLHKIQIRVLCLSLANHIAITQEIKEFEHLPRKCIVMPNGYFQEDDTQKNTYVKDSVSDVLNNVREKLMKERKKGNKILIFVGNEFPWSGMERIADLIEKLNNVFLLIVGKINNYEKITQLEHKGCVFRAGPMDPKIISEIYKMVDYGVGTFGLDMNKMTQACPLKVREYLWHGLPVIINYYDPLLDDDWSKEFIYRVDLNNLGSLTNFLNTEHQRDKIITQARYYLDWKRIFSEHGIL